MNWKFVIQKILFFAAQKVSPLRKAYGVVKLFVSRSLNMLTTSATSKGMPSSLLLGILIM
ncbi:hypothetical protein AN946_01545 [Trueperella pyogenes]|nr:hypothetical protein AN946_01545 [Trueperella pyogenes]